MKEIKPGDDAWELLFSAGCWICLKKRVDHIIWAAEGIRCYSNDKLAKPMFQPEIFATEDAAKAECARRNNA